MEHTDTFEEFLSRKKKEGDEINIDWDKRKNSWLKSIDDLFYSIKQWLSPFENKGLVNFKEKEIVCWEDYIGDYKAKKLEIFLGKDIVTLTPKGTFVFGNMGRIDMTGSEGEIMLLEHDWNKWKFARRTPSLITWDITEESFKDELQKLA